MQTVSSINGDPHAAVEPRRRRSHTSIWTPKKESKRSPSCLCHVFVTTEMSASEVPSVAAITFKEVAIAVAVASITYSLIATIVLQAGSLKVQY